MLMLRDADKQGGNNMLMFTNTYISNLRRFLFASPTAFFRLLYIEHMADIIGYS